MKITIINRFTKDTIVEGEFESLRSAVVSSKKDLYGANLSNADLSNADLCSANLHGADLSNAEIKISQRDDLIKSLKLVIEE